MKKGTYTDELCIYYNNKIADAFGSRKLFHELVIEAEDIRLSRGEASAIGWCSHYICKVLPKHLWKYFVEIYKENPMRLLLYKDG